MEMYITKTLYNLSICQKTYKIFIQAEKPHIPKIPMMTWL